MEVGNRFGRAYLNSYAEIPPKLIEDEYVADKKLGGHRRLFQPGSQEEVSWFVTNKSALITAYGKERVERFFKTTLKVEDLDF